MATFTAAQRRQLAASGAAMPGGAYPITNRAELDDAVRAVGRGSGSHNAIRKHIISRAKAIGATDAIPGSWTSTGARRTARQMMAGGN